MHIMIPGLPKGLSDFCTGGQSSVFIGQCLKYMQKVSAPIGSIEDDLLTPKSHLSWKLKKKKPFYSK